MRPENPLFAPATEETIGLLTRLNRQKQPIFVVPTKFISSEAAEIGYLLDTLYHAPLPRAHRDPHRKPGPPPGNYKTFFCNARYEALQGAIKIARHRQWRGYKHHGGRILLYDPTGAIKGYFLFEPEAATSAMLPGVEVVETTAALEDRLASTPVAACLLRLDGRLDKDACLRIRRRCSEKAVRFGLDFSPIPLAEVAGFFRACNPQADLYLWGEQLTDRQIPFGAFSMSDDTYRPWNSLQNCLLHSSTYSGNLLALNKVKQVLSDNFQWSPDTLKTCAEIEASHESKKRYFATHVNPNLGKLYRLTGYDLEIQEASGCYLTVKKGGGDPQVLVDCLSGGSLGIFGHNPLDLPAVLATHDPAHDYWGDLTAELARLTGFERAFPAVSGATAVENGMFAALLAQDGDKRKIIVFDENYSGKLLLPLVASPSKRQPSHRFAPLYERVVVIDAFAENAPERLLSEIRSGEIGLIWFEYIRGSDGEPIPEALIHIIDRYRSEYGYYVGIDEILMGLHRTGPLFSHHRTALSPDIVTLSKGLTYMSFPIGVTLVRSALYQRAVDQGPRFIEAMENRYLNQLGAHIALHCVERLQKDDIPGNVQQQSQYLYRQLARVAEEHRLVERIEMSGLFFGIHLKTPWWVKMGGSLGRTLYLLFLTKCWRDAGVFTFFDTRLTPALCLSEEDANRILESARKVLKMRPLEIFRAGIGGRP